jgi:hypothetical protein
MRTIVAIVTQAYSILACVLLSKWAVTHGYSWAVYPATGLELFVSYEIWSNVRRRYRRNTK